MTLSLIRLNNCGKSYLKHKYDLTIYRGDLWVISGANGSGKTTLIRLILGFIKPDFGVIEKEKYKAAYLPERVELPSHLSVIEYLKSNAKIKRTKLDLKLILDLEIPLYQKIGLLSKGNKQKVALVATFMGDSDLIILDEPLSGLDKAMTQKVKKIIVDKILAGTAFLISTHKPELFSDLAVKKLEL